MKLLWSSRSPFVRKVMIAAHEAGLADRITCERTVVAPSKPNPDVMTINPLNKLPTLILDDGTALYDSRVIVEHLDGLAPAAGLIPKDGKARIMTLRRQALGDGILDFLLLWLIERNRPDVQQSPELLAALERKFAAAFDHLEHDAGELADGPFDIGRIAIAAALGYADFRYAERDWRKGRPKLSAWFATIAGRPSLKATEHANVY